ncbi:EamA family transporter RarD [Aquabacterium sp. G14]|uniref:EamA family transporter RarD n=1 Tax=Aquabacterium sp. G14 TaxID=3130164 RepID=UPI0030A59268
MFKGVALSVLSTILFSFTYYYSTILKSWSGGEIFSWRLLLTVPAMTLLVIAVKGWGDVREIASRARNSFTFTLLLLFSSALLGVQQWLYLWAPVNGRALHVALGYFLMPLTMVIVGSFVYGERLSVLQKIAALLAALGVAHELFRAGAFSWEATLVAIGFPAYFVLRKSIRTENLGGLWFDMVLAIPFSVLTLFIIADARSVNPPLMNYFHVSVVALISVGALASYIFASRVLPFGLFGLLGYIEPILMLIVSFLIGESISGSDWYTYVPIWCALAVLFSDGVRHLLKSGPAFVRG